MCEKHLLGLTRNRLFEFENAVVFSGKFPVEPVAQDCTKALKMLCVKEPVLSGVIILAEDSSATLVTESVEQSIVFSEKPKCQIIKEYDLKGVDFSQKLFEFTVSADGWLIIAGHTAVSDGKSLLRLAMLFAGFYTRKNLSVEPSALLTFPDAVSLPQEILSPLTDKLSAELDNRWSKIKKNFTYADYKNARESFFSKRSKKGELEFVVDGENYLKLREVCKENGVDFSSLVAYGFYKCLNDKVKLPKKSNKLCVAVDRRFFINCAAACNVGGFDGNVTVSLSKKEQSLPFKEQVKAFQLSCYKASTSCYKSFYEEALLMKISPAYCDSAYMNLAGEFNHKHSRNLGENYTCKNTRLCRYFSVNLTQDYWSQIGFFETPFVQEPFKSRFKTALGLVMCEKCARISFRFDESFIAENDAVAVGEGALKLILNFKN